MSSFKYDPFQQKSIDFINQEYSVLVAAPTGAGKTAIAEHVMHTCLENKQKVIYTAPIKALSNQKYRDFLVEFPGQVGIMTGDVTINPDAELLIMTTEIFRNKILEDEASLRHYKWIIFDEIHYLDDLERGTVWEESLIFLPEHMRVLGLSATVPNIREIAKWLEKIHDHPVKVVQEDHRPVPLHIYYYHKGKYYDDFNKFTSQAYRRRDVYRSHRRSYRKLDSQDTTQQRQLIAHLQKQKLLPSIYFCFSRKRTEFLANQMVEFTFLNKEEEAKIVKEFDRLCKRHELENESSALEIKPLIKRGIAYHHAGMLPTLKEVVEQLFTSRLIKVIFTTETFAIGINMPARSVVFDDMCKYDGRRFGPMKTRDFYQMAGRAGRRGIDKEGYVFCCVDPNLITQDRLYKIIHSEPEKVSSRFNAAYATLLNLYDEYGEGLYDVYPYSLHFHQRNKKLRKRAIDDLRTKVKLLKEYGYIKKNKLTLKGVFATKVFGYEMILAELFDVGVLERLSQLELAVLSIAVVFEPRKGMRAPALHSLSKNLKVQSHRVLSPIQRLEKKWRLTPESKSCFFHLSDAMQAWVKGASFDDIMKMIDADEGEVVRYFRMSIQILRELLDTPIAEETKQIIYGVLDKINRDVIDSEKQLNVVD